MHVLLRSYAKINIHLEIFYKRKDGYHQIESIFCPITYGDIIRLELEKDRYIRNINDVSIQTINRIPTNNKILFEEVSERGHLKKNILIKLFEQIIERKILIPRIKITLIKRIPPGSGVGGGSSNAGTLIHFFIQNQFIDNHIGMEIAEVLGSDVPFFIYNQISYVSGRGEEIEELSPTITANLENLYGIINFNSFSVSTKFAYESLKKPLQEEYFKISGTIKSNKEILKEYLSNDLELFLRKCKNDFEDTILKNNVNLLRIVEKFKETNPLKTMMTGSGSGIFSLYRNKKEMLDSLKYLKKFESEDQIFKPFKIYTGQSPSGKASDFGSDIRRFESSLPSQSIY